MGRACSLKGGKTLISFPRRRLHDRCTSFPSSTTSPSQGVDLCTSLPTAPTTTMKLLADIALLDEVLKFQGTFLSSCFSWGEGPSSFTTSFWVPNSSTLGEDHRRPTLCLKRWEKGVIKARANVVKGPLSMVLQDGSEVVFPENVSFEDDMPFNKKLSNFKDFNRFLGMLVEGYEEKIVLLLKKLNGGGTLYKNIKKKVVFALHFERELKMLDCTVNYGEPVFANRRSDGNKWELILVD